MANKLKSIPRKPSGERTHKLNPDKLKPEKEEKVDLKKLAGDERTWKITGAVLLLIATFLFIAFFSYFLPGRKINLRY